ncbi:DNA primase [Salinispira pacifica]
MKIPDRIIEEISSRADIVAVVGEYVTLQKRGNRYWGLCPFHTEKTGSFTVSPERDSYYCFGCKKGGSIFNFLMEMEKVSFPEAVEMLGKRTGVAVPSRSSAQNPEDDEKARRRDALIELYRRLAGSFHHLLLSSAQGRRAVEYLHSRGLSPEVIDRFELGYAPADPFWLDKFLRAKGYSAEFLSGSGLFSRRTADRALFADRVIFPIRSRSGDTVAFGGRALSSGPEAGSGVPKYINSPDSELFHKGEHLYGMDVALPEIRRSGAFMLVEGYMDVIALHQAGVAIAIAPLGTAFTENQARLLRRYASTGYLLFDADEAGRSAAERAAVVLERQGFEALVVQFPDGKDPAEILERGDAGQLINYQNYTISILEYLITLAKNRQDVGTPRGKEFVLKEIFPYISAITSDIKREDSLGLVADALGVDRQAVIGDFRKKGGHASEPARAVPKAEDSQLTTDLFLMLATVVNRGHFVFVRRMLQPEDLTDGRARALFIALEECYRREESSLEMLLARLEDETLRTVVLEKTNSEEFSLNQEKSIKDAVYRIRQRNLEKKRQAVESQIRQSGRRSGGEEVKQLLELQQEKMYLDAELEKLKVMIHDRAAE